MFEAIFRKRSQLLEAQPLLQRIIDLVTPDMPRADEARYFRRYGRSIPVCLWELKRGVPVGESHITAVTKNLTDDSVGIVSLQELSGEHYCLAIWPEAVEWDEPVFFDCLRSRTNLVAEGMWEIGFQIEKIYDSGKKQLQRDLVETASGVLRPNGVAAAEEVTLPLG